VIVPVRDSCLTVVRPYFWAAVATLVAALANTAIMPLTGGRAPFLPFYPAIAITAFVFGARAGAVVLLLTLVLVPTFWLDARLALAVEELAALGIFALLSTALIWAAERYRRLQARNADALHRLELAERRFRIAQDASDVPFTLLAAVRDGAGAIVDFEWTYVNAAAGRALRRSPEHLVGRRLLAELPGNRQASELFRRYAQVVETGRGHDLELRYEADGIDGWFRNLATKLEDGVAIWFMDVTEQKRLEHSLRDQTERLQLAVEGAAMGTWFADLRTGRCVWNERHFRLGGLPVRESPRVEDWLALVHPDDRPRLDALYAQLLQGGGEWRPQYRIVRADNGETRWMEAYGRVLPDADGAATRFVGVVFDVTERKLAEEELRARTNELQTILDLAPIGIGIATGPGAEDIRINAHLAKQLGLPPGENASVTGPGAERLPYRFLRNGEPIPPDELPMQKAARTGQPQRDVEVDTEFADGRVLHMRVNAAPILDDSGNVRGVVATHVDVTEFLRIQRELEAEIVERRRAEEGLRDADQRKDVFLATLAHELRNPLAPARYALRLLRPDVPAETAEEARRIIERQLAQMARLIDDLLDINRITRGVFDLRLEPLDVRAIVTAAVETARPAIDAARHRLTVTLPDAPLPVQGDATRLAQAVGNLLNNAAKYTDAGGRIDVEGVERDGWIEVTVTDNGIGIAGRMLPRVFEMFAQVDGHAPRAQGGLGIGLALSRSLVAMHGGTLEAASEGPGHGSRFTLRLPRRVADAPAPTASTENVVPLFRARRRVVLADDNVDAARSLAQVLEMAGYVTHVAHDGLAAVEVAEVLHPDVLLLDIGMPKLNGYDAARLIRRQPWAQHATLVAITGWGQQEDRARSRDAGFDVHLTKPVDPDELLKILATTAHASPDAATAAGQGAK
jgi:PAS domain S-box-containing protein